MPETNARGAAIGTIAALFFVVSFSGCAPPPGGSTPSSQAPPSAPAPLYQVDLELVDEAGAPVLGAVVRGDGSPRTSADGQVRVSRRDPALLVIEAAGYLPEPVVVGPDLAGAPVSVRLLARTSPTGATRLALHFGGDVMLGRRYLTGSADRSALVEVGDGGASARAAVAALAPLFRAADVRMVNLETVVGSLPAAAAYEGKRFLLQSPPEALEALDELGVDVAVLGNNHTRDWLSAGVASTVAHLDAAGIAHAGGGLTDREADEAAIVTAAGVKVGVLSFTTVNGDFVNDSLPDASASPPANLPPEDAWQYTERVFGFGTSGQPGFVSSTSRRIGAAWGEVERAEAELAGDATAIGDLWRTATVVYPELQDWVARRGHGGAAPYASSRVQTGVAALRGQGADVVVVQIHGGFQFARAPSNTMVNAARAAIDAGADIVIGHHPHVLQGLEMYRGRPIALSLGNLVFDQDFLSTFSSVVLRCVVEAGQLVEARVFPVVLDGYRPVPVTGRAARRVLGLLHERSALAGRSERVQGVVRDVVRDPVAQRLGRPRFVREHGSARLVVGASATTTATVSLSALQPESLPAGAVVQRSPALAGLSLGRDIFGWGHLEDDSADGLSAGGAVWHLDGDRKRAQVDDGAAAGDAWVLRLARTERSQSRLLVRPVARITPAAHRLVDETGAPLDGAASYSLRLRVRKSGHASASLFYRFDVYRFFDQDPTRDPTSDRLRQVEAPISVPPDGAWHEVWVDLPAGAFAPSAGAEANAAMLYLGLAPPTAGEAEVLLDDVAVVEWRAADLPVGGGAVAADFIRARTVAAAGAHTLVIERD